MTKVINWNIDYVDTCTSPINGLEKVIKSCRYTVTISEDVTENDEIKTYSTSDYGYCKFDDPESETFIIFENLTKNQVLAWIWNKIDKGAVEMSLTGQLERKKSPPTVQLPLPN